MATGCRRPRDEVYAGDGSGRAGEDGRGRDGAVGNDGERQQPRRVPAPVQTQQRDGLEEMDWWDALTHRQQRAMMKRFMLQPPAAAPAPQPEIIQMPAPSPAQEHPSRRKMKRLHLEYFRGTTGESVEAWFATIPHEVERQEGLGGDTWTAAELYYGAAAHPKDGAMNRLIMMTENMREEDKNLAYLVQMMRKKYGRRDNMFRIQLRLATRVQPPGERLSDFAASLTSIGFEKRVPAESYVEAFINGINIETPAKKKLPTIESMEQLDWKKLGLGFGDSDEAPPSFDTEGTAISGLANTAQKYPFSLAALRALMLVAGIGRQDATGGKPAASKTKVARTLEVKGEDVQQASLDNQQQEQRSRSAAWQNPVGGYTGAYGSGVGGSGYGPVGGRGGGRGSGHGGGFGGRAVCGGQEVTVRRTPTSKRRTKREKGWQRLTKVMSDGGRKAVDVLAPSGQPKGKSGGTGGANQGKCVRKEEGDAEMLVQCEQQASSMAQTATRGILVEETEVKNADEKLNGTEVDMELGAVPVPMEKVSDQGAIPESVESSVVAQCGSTVANDSTKAEEQLLIPDGVRRQTEKINGGRTAAARRRHRRAEGIVVAVHGILAAEVRERREERAKVLRVLMRQGIAELRERADLKQQRHSRREAQITAVAVKKAEAARSQHVDSIGTTMPTAKQQTEERTEEEWLAAIRAPVDLVEGFGGGTSRVLGVWRFVGTTQYQQRITIDALLVEGQGDGLLIGEDWIVEHQIKMDFGSRELKYHDEKGQKVILPFTCHGVSPLQQASQERRSVVRDVPAQPDIETAPTGRPHRGHSEGRNGERRGVELGRPTRDLPALQALGTWIPTDDDMQILSHNGELERAMVAEWIAMLKKGDAAPLANEDKLDIGDMEAADKDLGIPLLRQYADIVEKKQGCPPLAQVNVEHPINTGNTAPIMLRRRRHAVSDNLLIDKEVAEMLSNKVIEPREGAWGFPLLIVRKKDESVRFCIDYRSLNAVTVKDVNPLPRIDETLEALHGSQRFTSLDLHSGYWQLAVAKEDRAKTAFTTRRGLFQFLRMPFGLCNPPSTFQRLMDCVLRGLTWVCCLVYHDTVVIFAKGTVAQHVVELAVVLERISEAGLSLKASKCSFATTKMECLGHDLTPDGIQPTDRLIMVIVDFPRPEDDMQENHVADALSRGPVPAAGGRADDAERLDDDPVLGAQPEPETISDSMEMNVDSAVQSVVESAAIRRVEAAELGIVQFTDDDIKREQEQSVMVESLLRKGAYRGQRAYHDGDGLVRAEVEGGGRIILPVVYWALAFKEAHDSIWAGHLRGPPTVRTGDVCDRWAIDVAGPLPVTAAGNRYVITVVEYTTRFAVAAAVSEHTAKEIARFLMDKPVLVFGPMREIMMDGAMEFGSKATAELLELMQVKRLTPVPALQTKVAWISGEISLNPEGYCESLRG
ncbi:unnamed protein product [Phytophthora fragariaefolia]|uniref:Unnamed protein product n=1 Tax=Phytophthora fragariaefolia TaxID=1490495 RepID=A0A9W6Y8N0_9STRA|nr:unnamed protein product [Phytophthora fragariaefolia]